jgi:hypothetical protein
MHLMRRIDEKRYNYTEFQHEGGYVTLTYGALPFFLLLDKLYVPPDRRRSGVGSFLIAQSVPLATELGTDRIISAITSREAYAAMVKVFGDTAIDVTCLGDFDGAPDTTKASLDYTIPPDTIL